ncbi:MAG TPA: hypothetical protein VEI02_06265 [Planctomycetota bacterium]|nr:hypothetical protein [Planctomycetota bacterium]
MSTFRLRRPHLGEHDPDDRRRVMDVVGRRRGPVSKDDVAALLTIAARPSGASRKIALDVLGFVARGDAAVADAVRRLFEGRLDQPWIARSDALAPGRIGVADAATLALLVRARKLKPGTRTLRVASKAALRDLGRPGL